MNKVELRRKKRAARKERRTQIKKRAEEQNQLAEEIMIRIAEDIGKHNYIDIWKKITFELKSVKLKKLLRRKYTILLHEIGIIYEKRHFIIPESKKPKKKKKLKINEANLSSTTIYTSNKKLKSIVYNRPKS